jgi:hypothetical protein
LVVNDCDEGRVGADRGVNMLVSDVGRNANREGPISLRVQKERSPIVGQQDRIATERAVRHSELAVAANPELLGSEINALPFS